MEPGTRVEIDFNSEKSGGVVIEVIHINKFLFATDNPMNSNPGNFEIIKSKIYQQYGSHIISNLCHKNLSYRRSQQNCTPESIVLCNACHKLSRFKDVFGCSSGHLNCIAHICPNVKDVSEISHIADYLKQNNSSCTYVNTRAKLIFNCWEDCNKFDSAKDVSFKGKFRTCVLCTFETSIQDIDKILNRASGNELTPVLSTLLADEQSLNKIDNSKVIRSPQRNNGDATGESPGVLKAKDALVTKGFKVSDITEAMQDLDANSKCDVNLIEAIITSKLQSVSTSSSLPPSYSHVTSNSDTLLGPIRVGVRHPLTNKQLALYLPQGILLSSIPNLIFSRIQCNGIDGDENVVYVQVQPSSPLHACEASSLWNIPLIFENNKATENDLKQMNIEPENADSIFISDITSNDVLVVRCIRENVGAKRRINVLKHEFKNNSSLFDKINTLSEVYEGWRSIRGDGNCYYRAVYFGLTEQIICTRDDEVKIKMWKELKQKISDVIYLCEDEHYYSPLLDKLTLAADGQCWLTVDEFESDILDQSTNIDLAFVACCRQLVAQFLLMNKSHEVNDGMSLENLIKSFYEDQSVNSMQEYCDRFILKLGEDAEGVPVDLGLLMTALGCDGRLLLVDRRAEVEITVVKPSQFSFNNQKSFFQENKSVLQHCQVHLLYRPGHYELLYADKSRDDVGKHFQVVNDNRTLAQQYVNKSDAIINSCTRNDTNDIDDINLDMLQDIGVNEKKFNPELIRLIVWCINPLLDKSRNEMLFYDLDNVRDITSINELSIISYLRKLFPSEFLEFELNQSEECVTRFEQSARELFNIPTEGRILYCTEIFDTKNTTLNHKNLTEVIHTLKDNDEVTILLADIRMCWIRIERYVDGDIINALVLIEAAGLSNMIVFLQNVQNHFNLPPLTLKSCDIDDKVDVQPGRIYLIVLSCELDIKVRNSQSMNMLQINIPSNILTNSTSFHDIKSYICNKININRKNVVLTSIRRGECIEVQSHANLNEIRIEDSVIDVIICHNPKCRDIISPIRSLRTCQHHVCDDCLTNYLNEFCREPHKELLRQLDENKDSDSVPIVDVKMSTFYDQLSIYTHLFSVNEEGIPLLLPNLRCFIPTCFGKLDTDDLMRLPAYEDGMTSSFRLYEEKRSYQYCSLRELTYCSNSRVPLSQLMQLGCGHFYHPSCLARCMNGEFDRAVLGDDQIYCFKCSQSKKGSNMDCSCQFCNDREDFDGRHIFNEDDAKELLKRCPTLFTPMSVNKIIEHSNKLVIRHVAETTKSCVFNCECGLTYTVPRRNDADNFACSKCGKEYCGKCLQPQHGEMTCELSKTQDAIKALGDEIVQACPNCNRCWGIPMNCDHATCDKNLDGCGCDFCFICGALRSPILAHGNNYHRLNCAYHQVGCESLCGNKCFEKNLRVCILTKKQPECQKCSENDKLCDPPDAPSHNALCKVLDVKEVNRKKEEDSKKQKVSTQNK